MTTPTYRLSVLGGLAIHAADGSAPALGTHRKKLAFLAALAAAGDRGVSRDRLHAWFWPESDTVRARNALNQFAHGVRRELGQDVFVGSNGDLRLNAAVVASDIADFRTALRDDTPERAAILYTGAFLDGVFVREAPDFERWVADTRAAIAQDYSRALDLALARAQAEERLGDAVGWARLLVEHDPLSTGHALSLMRALEQSGDTPAALRHAALHADRVRAELETSPDPALDQEVVRLRAAGVRQISPANGPNAALPTAAPRSEAAASEARPSEATTPDRIPSLNRRPFRSEPRRWIAAIGAAVGVAILWVIAVRVSRLTPSADAVGTQAAVTATHPPASSGTPERRSSATVAKADAEPIVQSTGPRATARLDVDPSRVLVPWFINRSGDSTIAEIGAVAADWITQRLSQAEVAKVVDGPTAFEVSRAVMKDAAPADSIWSVLSKRTRAGLVLSGTYLLIRDSIVLEARVLDMRDGTVLRAIAPIRTSRRDPMRGIELLSERAVGAVATIVDPTLASLSGPSSPPPLIEAYQDFLRGLAVYRRDDDRQARELFRSASRRDSAFMLPVVWAYLIERNFFDVTGGPTASSDSILSVLESHRARMAPIDRYALDAFQAERRHAPKPQRLAAIQRVSKLAPSSYWSYLEGVVLHSAGRTSEARIALERIDPEHGWARAWPDYWNALGLTQHYLHDYKAELETARRAAQNQPVTRGVAVPPGVRLALRALIGLGRADSALTLLRNLPITSSFYWIAATEFRAHGHRRESDSLYHLVLEATQSQYAGRPNQSVYFARYAIDAGSLDDAQSAAQRTLADSSRPGQMEARAILGMVAAERGDRASAESTLRVLDTFKKEYDGGLAAGFQAMVAGYLHDRQLVLRYFAEMEGSDGNVEPAVVATHRYRGLLWLDNDPVIRRPYIIGSP